MLKGPSVPAKPWVWTEDCTKATMWETSHHQGARRAINKGPHRWRLEYMEQNLQISDG